MASPKFDPNWSRLPAGTETPELRISDSSKYSNGDGTFATEAHACSPRSVGYACASFRRQDSTATVAAIGSGHASYQLLEPRYYKRVPDMCYLNFDTNVDGSWVEFDLSPIPDSSHILEVLHWYQYEVFHGGLGVVVTQLHCEPDTTPAEALFTAIRDGQFLSNNESCEGIGWKERELNELGRQQVASCLGKDWVALGISERNRFAGARGYGTEGGEDAPHLHVVYDVPGTEEPPGAALRRPALAIVPNPTTGRFVTVQYTTAAGTRGVLTLRDILGGTVKSLVLNPSGIVRLDLRGLAPGVYMATLESPIPPSSRKLVITTR